MPKSSKTTSKKRIQVKELPKSDRKLNSKEMNKVKGGLGPVNRQKKHISG